MENRKNIMIKKKILIIDDTELMIRYISDVLENAGYDVISSSNGPDGIQKVKDEKPDLVLLDIVMPGMDGFEVCSKLRGDRSNNLTPIIILTSQGNEEDKLKGLELGADDYIVKPFNDRELLSRVRNTLKRIDRNRWANPLTGLHGNIEIQYEISRRISNNDVFSVLYADLDNFKAFNDVYGFANGDKAIKLIADVIVANVHLFGSPKDFIGHIGGDDFVIVTSPDSDIAICEGIIKDFDAKIPNLYSEEHRKQKYITSISRQGETMKFPIMTISIAVVSNERRVYDNHLAVAEIAAELKKKAKSVSGSVYFKDRRTK